MDNQQHRDTTAATQTPASNKKGPSWIPGILSLCGILFVSGCLFLAHEDASARHEETEMAVRLARMDGHQLCNLAYLSASSTQLNGRTPSIYAPKRVLVGPPAIFECDMIREGGVSAEPLIVIQRCTSLREDCVEVR